MLLMQQAPPIATVRWSLTWAGRRTTRVGPTRNDTSGTVTEATEAVPPSPVISRVSRVPPWSSAGNWSEKFSFKSVSFAPVSSMANARVPETLVASSKWFPEKTTFRDVRSTVPDRPPSSYVPRFDNLTCRTASQIGINHARSFEESRAGSLVREIDRCKSPNRTFGHGRPPAVSTMQSLTQSFLHREVN